MSSHGVLLVDKPRGMSSHRVVGVARKALGTREVGHAGTLDPMATGLLVLGVGEGTKLLGHLTGHAKRYEAHLRLGTATDTLDADGEVVQSAPLPDLNDAARVEREAQAFVGTHMQVPPAISAIKQQGVPLYARVRRGESVQPSARQVTLHSLVVRIVDEATLSLDLHAGKGYYVRSLGRDLASALDSCGHLSALRRTASGALAVTDAVPFELLERAAAGDLVAKQQLAERVLSPAAAAHDWPAVVLDEAGCADAWHGRRVRPECMLEGEWPAVGVEPVALLSASRQLVAIGTVATLGIEVLRGLRYDA